MTETTITRNEAIKTIYNTVFLLELFAAAFIVTSHSPSIVIVLLKSKSFTFSTFFNSVTVSQSFAASIASTNVALQSLHILASPKHFVGV